MRQYEDIQGSDNLIPNDDATDSLVEGDYEKFTTHLDQAKFPTSSKSTPKHNKMI